MPEPIPESVDGFHPRPVRSRNAVAVEIGVVLAVGVIPHVISAVSAHFVSTTRAPHWLDTVSLTGSACCTIFVVLYLMSRSEHTLAEFGVRTPQAALVLAYPPLLLITADVLWGVLITIFPEEPTGNSNFPFGPRRWYDVPGLFVKYAANGLAEELVVRAYLLTRLVELFRSRGAAVLVSAALFASYHVYHGGVGTAYVFLLGIAFGVAFLAYRNVWPVALAHMLIDVWIEWYTY